MNVDKSRILFKSVSLLEKRQYTTCRTCFTCQSENHPLSQFILSANCVPGTVIDPGGGVQPLRETVRVSVLIEIIVKQGRHVQGVSRGEWESDKYGKEIP